MIQQKKSTCNDCYWNFCFLFLDELLDGLRIKCHNLTCNVVPIMNDFFGHTINVTGLITGRDMISQLKGMNLGDELILTNAMLRHEGDVFLDDVSLDDVSRELQVKITVVPNDGYELLNAVVGSDNNV